MSWINANLAGTKQVFSFTATQFLKNRSNIFTFVLLFLLCLVSVPLMALLNSGTGASVSLPAQSSLSQVFFQDDTDLSLSWAELAAQDTYYAQTQFLPASQLSGELGEDQVLVHLSQNSAGSYQLELSQGAAVTGRIGIKPAGILFHPPDPSSRIDPGTSRLAAGRDHRSIPVCRRIFCSGREN